MNVKRTIAFITLVLSAIMLFSCEEETHKKNNYYLGERIPSEYQTSIVIRPLDDFFEYTTDIVKAKFVDVVFDASNDQWFFEFETIESVRGRNEEKTLLIKDQVMEYGWCDPDGRPVCSSTYKQGENYLLLLRRSTSVYSSDEVRLSFVCQYLIIPLDNENKAYLKRGESFLWGDYLGNYIESKEIIKAFENGKFEEYLLNETKSNPLIIGDEYIKSTNMTEVLRESDYVIEVVIKYINDGPSSAEDRVVCECLVLSELKGKLNYETPTVIFPQGKYAVGEKYIVAVSPVGSPEMLKMSSRNSVYSIDQKDEIISILSE